MIGQLTALAALGLAGSVQAAGAFDPESKWMTGDWDGTRTELLEKGYDFTLEYVGEVAGNLKGGYNDDKTARYSDQFALGVKLDLEKILGWNDAEARLTITERSGRNLSNDRISDPRAGHLSSVQEVWGRGQTWRLTQMWVKQKYFDGALDVKVGRFGEGEDFNSFPCDFQNLAFCGSQVGNWVGDIWYNWPVSQWALRVKYNITPEFFAQIGVYEQNPSYLETGNAFKLSGSGTEGMILPVELVWSPQVNALPGEYRVGYYYSTAKADDVYEGADGQPQPLTPGGEFRSHSSKHGWWVVAQQQVTSHNGDVSRGLNVFANLTVHDKDTNTVDNYQQVGVVYKGPFDARPKDDIGFGVARIHVNDDVKKRAQLVNDLNGIDDYDNPAFLPIRETEYNAELYYGVHVTNWLTVRPNLQYVKHPGAVDEVDDAIVAGVKIQSVF
ncbi:carbohydrate porin [Pseudomonas sp. LS1212]|uniref:carbohydrate porin n=1 Tax=Pseudomonas sp. LS1212 TaxID=2972478 RepID=UPI0038CD38CC